MLKTSVVENHSERRLIFEGRLLPPWVTELIKNCLRTGQSGFTPRYALFCSPILT
jgi:hypothetical protein